MSEAEEHADDGHTALSRQTTVFLDVDGVLNSFPVSGLRYYRERRRTAHAWRFRLHYRPAIVRRLEHIVRTHDARLVWLSTWSHRCTEELEPALGFRDTHEVVPMPDASYNRHAGNPHMWWKARHVAAWLDEDPARRAVWVDDDLASARTHAHFAERYPDRLLMIVPTFSRGLTGAHLRALRRFLSPLPGQHHGHGRRVLQALTGRRAARTAADGSAERRAGRSAPDRRRPVPASTGGSPAPAEAIARPPRPSNSDAGGERPPRVGLLDSGLGLTGFAGAILDQAPGAELVLAMDPDNMPYGRRSPERLRELAEASARRLEEWGPEAIVVACNSASVHALEHLRSVFEPRIPVIGTVPAVKTAAELGAPFAVWATTATTGSEYQRRLIDAFAGGLPVARVAAADLAEAIESGDAERISAAVAEAAEQTPDDIASVVLGCTHYGLVGTEIGRALRDRLGREVELFDSPQAVAAQTLRRVWAQRAQQAVLCEETAPARPAIHAGDDTNSGRGDDTNSGSDAGRVLATYLSGRRARLPQVLSGFESGRRLIAREDDENRAPEGKGTEHGEPHT